ncbi:MAG: hypothetical protein II921_07460 [Treponema sp.]|nr:hypothetical protein [Treponema sp.]
MKKLISAVLFSLLSAVFFAQSSQALTEILESENLTYGQLAYLIGTYKDIVKEDDTDIESTVKAFSSIEYFPKDVKSTDKATLGTTSMALTKATGVRGGVFYRLTYGCQRYAIRELKAKNILPPSADISNPVTGKEAIGILYALISDEVER